MALALKIIGWWVLLSCTLGPCLTWLFFYGERQIKYEEDRRRSVDSPIISTGRLNQSHVGFGSRFRKQRA
jgi:hypothetical protein